MRKILFFFVALFLLNNVGWTQNVANYSFASSSGTYTAITGGTVIVDGTTSLDSWASSTATTIPSFTFDGIAYTTAWVTSNGLLTLGGTAPSSTEYSGISNGSGSGFCICPFNADLDRVNTTVATEIRTETIGNEVVFQWKQFKRYGRTESFDFQVKLNTSTGVISFVYQLNSGPDASTLYFPQIGIRASATNFKNLSITDVATDPTWSNPTSTGNVNTATCRFTSASNAKSFTSGLTYTFTPPVPCVTPTSLAATASSSAQTISTVDGSFTAATTPPSGYVVVRTTTNVQPVLTDATSYTVGTNVVGYIDYVGTTPGSWTSTALNGNTTYYYWVFSFNSLCIGAPVYSASATTFNATTLPCGTYSGTMTVGPTGIFSNLTTAITNLGACGYTGNIILELQAAYVSTGETFPINFTSVLSSSAVKTITIRPETGATGLSITSANTTGTINLNGASYITFDGRPGGVGASELTISNTNVGNSYAVKFVNDANNNALNYCKINSVNNSTSGGTIVFGTTTGTNGNDNNTISYCNIYDGTTTPYNAIYASGSTTTAATYNNNNTISNCNIYNYYATASVSSGVYLSSGNTDWTILNNNFYQTATRVGNASSNYGIYINNSGNNFSVTGNNIGGSVASCGGTAWTYSLGGATRFVGIYLYVGTITASSVQNNTVANLSLSSTSGATTMPGVFSGIYLSSGNANIGTVTGNIIGSGTGTGSISVSSTTTGAINMGIGSASAGTVSISNNTIGSINVMGSGVLSASFNGIWNNTGATALVINNNTVGSPTTANSINYSNAGTGTAAAVVQGIVNSGSATAISITNNTIANLNSSYMPTVAKNANIVCGINSTSGANTITGNTIYNLSTAANATGTTSSASVIGLYMTSTTAPAVVSQNTIYGLSSTHATAAVCVTGIHYGGPTSGTNLVARNMVHGLNIVSSSATADMRGLNFSSGLAKVQNNVIRLGFDAAGTALTSGIQITGLFDAGSTANIGMYFNSVYIGGAGVNTVAGNTYAFKSSVTTNARIYQNNIFFNGRSNATTGGKHYAMMVSGTGVNPAGLTLNYNDYMANGTGAVLGYYGADVADLAAWKTAVGQDVNSISADPLFVAPTAAIPNLNLTTSTPCEGTGFDIASITDDYTGALRSGLTPVDMGAYAGLFAPAGIDMKPTAITAPLVNGCLTATETVTVKILNAAGSIIDFAVNPVTVAVTGANAAAAYNSNTTVNTGTLAIGGTLDVSMPATIDMTASGTYSFNATTSVTGDINTANDALATVNKAVSSMGGTYTVGATGTFVTLTAAVNAYNNATCITGPVEFSLTDATYYTGETYPIVINANTNASATKTLTIKPATGVTATITGNATSILKLNGADYVIIDGSNNGTTTKDLTIKDSSTAGSSVILISSLGANLGATNNAIKNTNIQAGATTSGVYGISIGTTVGVSGADNDNNTIQNNNISKAYVGIYALGSAIANPGLMDNLQVVGNSIGSATATDYISHDGITLANATGSNVSQNTVYNLIIAASTPVGISLGTGVVSTTLTRNNVNNVTATGTSGYGGRGIYVNTGNATSDLTISNNLVYAIGGDGYTGFSNSSPVGIYIDGTTGGLNIYNNSVNMNSATLTYSGITLTAALLLNTSTITAVDLRNNVFVNTMNNTGSTTAKNYAIYSSAANTAFTNINNNDYYVSGTQGVLGYLASDQTTLASLVTSFGQNANSISANPLFVAVPVELTPTSPALNNTGVTIATVTVDYTGATRSATPDMGAVEFTPPTCYAPTALNATLVTAIGATLGWTAGGTETDWNVEYGATGFTQGTGTIVPVSTTPTLALTTLTQNAVYQFYVQANCGVPGTSTWTGPFSFTTPYSCPKPTLPTATNISSNSADLGWTAGGTETAWIVYYKKVADADYTEILNVTTNPYNISGLDPSTNYIFKVKANCSVSDTSVTSDTKTFTTACGAVTSFPFFENFNSVTTPALPNCFSQIDGNTDGEYWVTYSSGGVSGSKCARLYTDGSGGNNNDFLVLPQFTLSGNQQLKFSVKAYSSGEPNDYKVVLSTTDNLPASFTTELKPLTVVSSTTITEIAPINLSAYSGNVWIAVQVPAGGLDGWYLYVDDITVENIPTCIKPTALTASSITSSDATISWTRGATETAWNVEYGPVGFVQGTGTALTGVVDTSYALADLTAATTYSFYVQADCGIANGQSVWAGPYTFTTTQIPAVLPYAEGFEVWPDNWSVVNGTQTNKWAVGSAVANTGTQSAYVSNDNGVTNAYNLSSSSIVHMYRDITFPATLNPFSLNFNWKGDGESGYDYLRVYLVPTSTIPVAGTLLTGELGTYNQQTTWQTTDLTLANATYANQTWRLVISWKNDGSGGTQPPIAIDDISITELACAPPTALNAPSISNISATLAWTAGGTETAWNVEYGLTGFTQGTGTMATPTTNSLAVTSLVSATTYQFYVQANCGGANGTSTWAGPFTFTTACDPFTSFPLTESFDGTTFAPICWSNTETDAAGTDVWDQSTAGTNPACTPQSGTGMARFNCYSFSSGVKAELVTPSLNLSNDFYQVSFWMYRDDAYTTNADLVNVYYNTAPNSTGGTLLGTIHRNDLMAPAVTTPNQWYQYTFNMPTGSAGTNRYVIFEGVSAFGNNIFIDDVSISTTTPVCATPTALAATNIGETTADLGWTSTSANFNVRYRIVGAATWSVASATSTTLPLAGLTANTQYEFEVQAVCSATAGDTSAWATAVTFTTIAASACATPTALVATNITLTTADLGWTSTAANFNVRYRIVGSATWTASTASAVTLPLTSLTANTQYEFQVQAICSATAGDTSNWTSTSNFTTISNCATPAALAATSIAQNTATLGWTSTAANFNVRYRVVGSSTWTNTTATAITLPVTGLTANTQYEFQVQAVCSATVGDISAWATAVTFTTLATPVCATPTALAATSIAQTTATLGWTSTAANFNVRYRTVGSATWTPTTATAITLAVTGLTANTQYEFQVQAVCSATAGDTSAWAIAATFTTLAVGTCPEPTALVVSAISEVGATLNWTAGGTETAWNLRYKKVADATYTNVANTSTKPYILTALQSSTAYVWNVQAVCSGTLTSIWSVDNTFTTTVGIESNSISALKVYSFENQVNVINNGNLLVKEVVIYDVLGQEVGKFAINSTDNILINTNLTIGNYVVKVITAQQVGTYKLFIK